MPVLVYIIYSRTSRPIGQEVLYGAGDEARTRYLHLGKVALYRMSYTRILKWCLRSESNQRHADFQSAALPTELQRHLPQMRVRRLPDSLGIIPQEGTFVNIFLQECEKFFLVSKRDPINGCQCRIHYKCRIKECEFTYHCGKID